MTIAFIGHVESMETGSKLDTVQLTLVGEVAVCRDKIVVNCSKSDAKMYTPGTVVRIQVHPS